jgi:hypothetical protein
MRVVSRRATLTGTKDVIFCDGSAVQYEHLEKEAAMSVEFWVSAVDGAAHVGTTNRKVDGNVLPIHEMPAVAGMGGDSYYVSVSVPSGAAIKSIEYWHQRTGGTHIFRCWASDFSTGQRTQIGADVSVSSGTSLVGTIDSPINHIVTPAQSLVLEWTRGPGFPGVLGFYGAKIVYDPCNEINVRSYGAIGDSTTDDTNAIDRALEDLHIAGGGTLYLPRGTYLTKAFVIPSGVTLRGDGMGATTILCDELTELDWAILIGSRAVGAELPAHGVVLRDFKLDARGEIRQSTLSGGYVRGISSRTGCTNIVIERVHVHDGGSRAIEINRSTNCWVVGCLVTDSSRLTGSEGDGIHFEGAAGDCHNIVVAYNQVDRCGDTAIAFTCCREVTVLGNIVRGAAFFGVTPGADETGIDALGASNVVIIGNQVLKIKKACIVSESIQVDNVDYDPHDISIVGNTLEGSGISGDHLIKVGGRSSAFNERVLISGNRLKDAWNAGIVLGTHVRDFNVTANCIDNPYLSGEGLGFQSAILLGSSSGNPIEHGTVAGNTIVGDDSHMGSGVFLNSGCTGVTVYGNSIRGYSLYEVGDLQSTATPTRLQALRLPLARVDLSVNGSGVGTVRMKGPNSLDSAGFVALDIDGTTYYVPVFTAVT